MSASVNYNKNIGCNFKTKVIDEYAFSAKYIDEHSFLSKYIDEHSFSALIYNLANIIGLYPNFDMVFVTDIANSCFSKLEGLSDIDLGTLSISEKNKLNTFVDKNLGAGLFYFDSASIKIALEQLADIKLNDIDIDLNDHAIVNMYDSISAGVFLSKIFSVFLAEVQAYIDCGVFDSEIKANIATALNDVVNIGFLTILSKSEMALKQLATVKLNDIDIDLNERATVNVVDDISAGTFLSKLFFVFLAEVQSNIDCGFFDSKIKTNIATALNDVVNIGFLNILPNEIKSDIYEVAVFNLFSVDIRSPRYALLEDLDYDLLSQFDEQTLYNIENLFYKCFLNATVKSKSQIDHGVFSTSFSTSNIDSAIFNVDLGSCAIRPTFSFFINESSALSFNDIKINAMPQKIYKSHMNIDAELSDFYITKLFVNSRERINLPYIELNAMLQYIYKLRMSIDAALNSFYLTKVFVNAKERINLRPISINALSQNICKFSMSVDAELNSFYITELSVNAEEQMNLPSIKINAITTLDVLASLYELDDNLLNYYDSMTLADMERSVVS